MSMKVWRQRLLTPSSDPIDHCNGTPFPPSNSQDENATLRAVPILSWFETQNAAAEIRLRAERKAGSILNKMEKAKHRHATGNKVLPVKLDEIGITKMQSSRWQLSSKVSESEFARIVAECSQDSERRSQQTHL